MEIFGYFPENAVAYANRINHLRDVLPDQIRLIHLVAPPAIAFNGLEELEAESKIVYQAIDQIYQAENDSIIKVDAITNIAKHTDEYIYFNTDHHWTGRGAYYAYQAFCLYTGQTATALKDMELTKPDYEFLGTLYSFTGNSPLLENSKDQAEIFCLNIQVLIPFTVIQVCLMAFQQCSWIRKALSIHNIFFIQVAMSL